MIKATIFTDGEWEKGGDFMDESPRYQLLVPYVVEGRGRYCDSLSSALRWSAVVVQEKVREYRCGPLVKRYFGHVNDLRLEVSDEVGPFKSVKAARHATERALKELREYCKA